MRSDALYAIAGMEKKAQLGRILATGARALGRGTVKGLSLGGKGAKAYWNLLKTPLNAITHPISTTGRTLRDLTGVTLKRTPGKFGIGTELEKDFGSKAYWLRRGKALARKGVKGAVLTDALRRPAELISDWSGIDAGTAIDVGKQTFDALSAAEDQFTKIRLGTDDAKALSRDLGIMGATSVASAGLDFGREKMLDMANTASARASKRYQAYIAELRKKGIAVENGDAVLQKYINDEINAAFDEYQKTLQQKAGKLSGFVSDVNSALETKKEKSIADAARVFMGLRAERNGGNLGAPTALDHIPNQPVRLGSRALSVLPFAQVRTIVNPILSGYASYKYRNGGVLQALKDAGKSFIYELPWGDKLFSHDQIVDGRVVKQRPIPQAYKPTDEEAKKIVEDAAKGTAQKGKQLLEKGKKAVGGISLEEKREALREKANEGASWAEEKLQKGTNAVNGVKNKITDEGALAALGWPSVEEMRAAGVREETIRTYIDHAKWSVEYDAKLRSWIAALEAEIAADKAREKGSVSMGKAKDRANLIKRKVKDKASKFDAEAAKREASDRAKKGMGRAMRWFGSDESDDE